MRFNKERHPGLLFILMIILSCAHTQHSSFRSSEDFDSDQLKSLTLIGCDYKISKENIIGFSSVDIDKQVKLSLANHLRMFNINFSDYTDSLNTDPLIREKINYYR